jgi:integrase
MLINSKRYSSTDIAHQLGHSSSNITMRTYAHMLEPTKLSIAQTLDDIKKGG